MNKRILAGGLTGGVVSFFLGWLIYGILLSDFSSAHYNDCMARSDDAMIMWAMAASNLAWGFLLAIILFWAGALDLKRGIMVGGVVGFLMMASFDLSFYSMTEMFLKRTAIVVDVSVGTVFTAVTAGISAIVMGKVHHA